MSTAHTLSPAPIVRRARAEPLEEGGGITRVVVAAPEVTHDAARAIGRGAFPSPPTTTSGSLATSAGSRFSLLGGRPTTERPTASRTTPPAVDTAPSRDAVALDAPASTEHSGFDANTLLPKAYRDALISTKERRGVVAPVHDADLKEEARPPPQPAAVPAVDVSMQRGSVSASLHSNSAWVPASTTATRPTLSHLVTVEELLGSLSSLFSFKQFNSVQSACAPALVNTDDSVVIAAPTGSGKTALLELAILRLFRERLVRSTTGSPSANQDSSSLASTLHKAVYVCPIKALAAEKFESWQRKFSASGLRVVLETGDGRSTNTADSLTTAVSVDADIKAVLDADVLITTPERWDSLTRRWRQAGAASLIESVRLLLVDEVHVLGERRGAVIEALVSRMKTINTEILHNATTATCNDSNLPGVLHPLRFVAVSGTISNAADIAEWLGAPHLFQFSDADRPVPLRTHVVAIPSTSKNSFQFDKLVTFRLLPTIRQYSSGKPSLIFCSSRRECSHSATHIVQEAKYELVDHAATSLGIPPAALRSALLEAGTQCDDAALRQCVPYGVAFHHAALSPNDRRRVEQLFCSQHLRVICTTTTLALGVNLPARLVIVKGTSAPARGGGGRNISAALPSAGNSSPYAPDDLPLSDVAQMCGRAGRPGQDTEGVAVILADDRKAPLYMVLDTVANAGKGGMLHSLHVESTLHENVIEHINAEVCLGTISTPSIGVLWLQTTYLWTRLQKNPQFYGVELTVDADPASSASEQEGSFAPSDDVAHPQPSRTRRIARGAADTTQIAQTLAQITGDVEEEDPDVSGTVTSFPSCMVANDAGGTPGTRRFARKLVRAILKDLLREGCVELQRSVVVPSGDAGPTSNSSSSTLTLVPTRLGKLMAQYYLDFETVRLFNRRIAPRVASQSGLCRFARFHDDPVSSVAAANDDDSDEEPPQPSESVATAPLRLLLEVLCQSNELNECRVRLGDKQHLNALNPNCRFPLASGGLDPKTKKPKRAAGGRDVRAPWHKPFVLAQAVLASESTTTTGISDWSIRNDCIRLMPVLARLSKALVEYCAFVGGGPAIVDAWRLQRSFEQLLWFDTPRSAKQLDGVGDITARALERIGFGSLEAVMDADPRRLEAAAGRHPPYGSDLQLKARSIPVYCVSIDAPGVEQPDIVIHVLPAGAGPSSPTATPYRKVFFTLVVYHSVTRDVLVARRFRAGGSRLAAHQYTVKPQAGRTIEAHLINEAFVGLDCVATYTSIGHPRRVPRPAEDHVGPRRPSQPQPTEVRPSLVGRDHPSAPEERVMAHVVTVSPARSAKAGDPVTAPPLSAVCSNTEVPLTHGPLHSPPPPPPTAATTGRRASASSQYGLQCDPVAETAQGNSVVADVAQYSRGGERHRHPASSAPYALGAGSAPYGLLPAGASYGLAPCRPTSGVQYGFPPSEVPSAHYGLTASGAPYDPVARGLNEGVEPYDPAAGSAPYGLLPAEASYGLAACRPTNGVQYGFPRSEVPSAHYGLTANGAPYDPVARSAHYGLNEGVEPYDPAAGSVPYGLLPAEASYGLAACRPTSGVQDGFPPYEAQYDPAAGAARDYRMFAGMDQYSRNGPYGALALNGLPYGLTAGSGQYGFAAAPYGGLVAGGAPYRDGGFLMPASYGHHVLYPPGPLTAHGGPIPPDSARVPPVASSPSAARSHSSGHSHMLPAAVDRGAMDPAHGNPAAVGWRSDAPPLGDTAARRIHPVYSEVVMPPVGRTSSVRLPANALGHALPATQRPVASTVDQVRRFLATRIADAAPHREAVSHLARAPDRATCEFADSAPLWSFPRSSDTTMADPPFFDGGIYAATKSRGPANDVCPSPWGASNATVAHMNDTVPPPAFGAQAAVHNTPRALLSRGRGRGRR